MSGSFSSLGLSAELLRSIESAGFVTPTPIQAGAIPAALSGKDVVGVAATGTGKTAAFVLPILEKHQKGVALVLAPTRELALQIAEQVERLSSSRGVRVAVVIGGVGMGNQIRELKNRPQIIVATPGRLVDHLEQRTAQMEGVTALVLDEADRMLDMGFRPQLNKILAKVPKARQTLLFSATMGEEVSGFIRANTKDPVRVEISKTGTTAARAEQLVFEVGQNEKTALLLSLLDGNEDSTLVFTRTKRRADKVARSLERAGQKVSRIHADRSQSQRQQALEGFRSGRYRVLVATDIAARGIDVEEIGHVVNYDLPHVPADYVHRVGRTARAAASGRASSFTSPEEAPLLRDIEKYTRTRIARGDVPRTSEEFRARVNEVSERQERHAREQGGGRGHGGHGGSRQDGGRGHGGHGGGSRQDGGRGGNSRHHGADQRGGSRHHGANRDQGGGTSQGGGEAQASRSAGTDGGRSVFRGGPRRR